MQPSLQVYSEAASVSLKRLSIFLRNLIRAWSGLGSSRPIPDIPIQVVFVLLPEPYSVSLLSLASLKYPRWPGKTCIYGKPSADPHIPRHFHVRSGYVSRLLSQLTLPRHLCLAMWRPLTEPSQPRKMGATFCPLKSVVSDPEERKTFDILV